MPGNAHKAFCTIPFDIVCTTNFDFLLERQYAETQQYVYPVVDEEQLSINDGNAGTLLFKLHGDLRHPNRLIVTEADYDGFLQSYPLLATYLSHQLITKTGIFIGYSLDDPDFRQIWHVVSERLGRTRRMAYALAVGARPGDVARFERRGVRVINLAGNRDKYDEVSADTFKELREYMRDNVISVSKVTEEKPLQELMLPRDSTTRLCFFSLPLDLLPFYRERVFPLVEEIGSVPVTADDVITPGENVSAKVDVLIDRASVMVVELTSPCTIAEYHMAIARIRGGEANSPKRRLHLIVVVTQDGLIPASAAEFPVIVRSNVLTEDSEDFISTLENRLREIANEFGSGRFREPWRLLEAKEYRAAVISAMTLLETRVRERLNDSRHAWFDQRPKSLRWVIDQAIELDFIPRTLGSRISSWMRTRNKVVHTSMRVSKAEAREIVEGVFQVLRELK